MNLRLVQ